MYKAKIKKNMVVTENDKNVIGNNVSDVNRFKILIIDDSESDCDDYFSLGKIILCMSMFFQR